MAFGSASAAFDQFVKNPLMASVANVAKPTGFGSLTADALKCALYNNTGTPNKSDTLANTGYNTGQWVTANEVIDTSGNGNWPAGGEALSSLALGYAAGAATLSAANTPGGGTLTLANVYGALIYDSTVTAGTTVAKQGICYLSFGGTAQGVTLGSFTVVYSANGILQITN
jgi:hypothetical protein